MKSYRQLIDKEIATLVVYGCSAESWKQVEVGENFKPDYISNVHFSGEVKLGVFEKSYDLPGGLKKHSGLYNCHIHNCTIGDNVYINKISNYIANYEIGDNTYIENVDLILTEGKTSFGNGVRVAALNENGERSVPIFDNLSASLAYMLTLYQYRPELIKNLHRLIDEYTQSQSSEKGIIGENVRIFNGKTIKNIKIGDKANLSGFNRLENGTVNSNAESPVMVGEGVICEDFILSSGSIVRDSAILTRCFVGQNAVIEKQYSATDTLIFSNSHLMHGESVSVFAGPFTVSHHKSTLLIGSMVSFINCGSGTNQSNHMYKSGPVHQGIIDRGCKTASNSYAMFPAHIGAFSMIMGSHKQHSDTSELPFSYLIENNGESYLVPAVNLRSFGTVRDADKWLKRDKRTASQNLDLIHVDLLNPYSIQQILKGIKVLRELKSTDALEGVYIYNHCKIKVSSLEKGIKLYETAVVKYMGDCLISKLKDNNYTNIDEIRNELKTGRSSEMSEWVDMSGLFAPKKEVELLINEIEKENISLEQIQQRFDIIYKNYLSYEWSWIAKEIGQCFGKDLNEINSTDVIDFLGQWEKVVDEWSELIYQDGKKEFEDVFQVGYGIDGNKEERVLDFKTVRGDFNDNPFLLELKKQTEEQKKRKNNIVQNIQSIS